MLAALTLFSLSGCFSFYDPNGNRGSGSIIRAEAYVPIYGTDTALRRIGSMAPQPTASSGKIYVFGSYLFQVEKFKGVHVIDYSDKTKPVKLSFIKSGGALELAVKNGYLITNNADDLVTIDIRDPLNAKEVARVPKAFKNYEFDWYTQMKPPKRGSYYVCPDYYMHGDVIGWKLEKNVSNAYCYSN
jgi:hypothetical protein